MTCEPYTSARRVFWVVDNGGSHRGWTAATRLTEAFANATMIHLPVHFLAQPDWNLLLGRTAKAAHPRRLSQPQHPGQPAHRVRKRYNSAARPFDCRFNRNDVNRLLTRIAA